MMPVHGTRGAVGVEPLTDRVDPGDLGLPLATDLVVAGELAPPATDLALEVALWPTEVAETDRHMVDGTEGGSAVDERKPHRSLQGRIGSVRLGEPNRRVESVDGLHQVEAGAEHLGIGLAGDEARMWHVGVRECGEDPGLATHGVVAVGPLVQRRSPQDIVAVGSAEAEQDVLRAPGQWRHISEVAGPEGPFVHPLSKSVEIDPVDLAVRAVRAVRRHAVVSSGSDAQWSATWRSK